MNETYFKNGNFDLELCKKDAENGNMDAIIILSNFYQFGEPDVTPWICENMKNIAQYYQYFERNSEKSIEWFEKAAEMGSVDAMVQVANLYRFSEEESKAIYWLTKGAKLNYFPAMIGLIEILDDKNEVENWISEAEKIAEDYSAKDIFNFAQALRQNYFEKALYWYKVSSDLDFSKATLQLEIINLSSDYKKNKTNDLLSKLVKKITAFCLELDEEKVLDDSSFPSNLGADDLDMFELAYQIEEELGISIPDEELCDDIEEDATYSFKFETVKDLIELCKKYSKI